MTRVLVIGARGFIGRSATDELVRRGHEVHALTSSADEPATRGIQWHHADLLAGDGCRRILDDVRPTHLLHLAWVTAVGTFWTDPSNEPWFRASRQLIRDFASCGGRRVVAAGTCAEYDWSTAGVCDEASTPLRPATPYGRWKDALRQELETATGGVASSAWARVFWLYGPGEPRSRLVPSIAINLLRGEPALCSSGTQRRDFSFVADVAAAMVQLLDSDVRGAVNVASGEAVPVADVAMRIGRLIGRPELVRLGARPTAAAEPPLVVADVRRLRDEVGYSPRFDLDAGLAITIDVLRAAHAGAARHA